jgi:hypothetical protein
VLGARKFFQAHSLQREGEQPAAMTDILAAVDASASDDPRIAALNMLHAKKVRSLMASISELNAKVQATKAQNKDHRRSSMIQSLRSTVREHELVVDVLKKVGAFLLGV